MEAATVLQET